MFWQPRPPCSLRLVRSQSKKGRDRGGIPPGVPDMAWSRRETWPDIEREEVTIRHYRCVHCAAILVGREELWSNVTQPSLTPARPTGWAHLKWAPLSHGAHVTAGRKCKSKPKKAEALKRNNNTRYARCGTKRHRDAFWCERCQTR